MKTTLVLVITLCFLMLAEARDFRELTNLEGKKIQAELLDLKEDQLKIRANSRVFEVPMDKLSTEDQDFVKKWSAAKKGESEESGGDGFYTELIFKDDFSSDGFGEGWQHYKSASEVKDGVFAGITAPDSDHQAVDTIKFEGRQDLQVSVKFKFTGPDAKRFNLKFDDNNYKGAHAGHICRVVVSLTKVRLSDGKTGVFKNEIFEKKKAGEKLDEATEKLLESKLVQVAVDLEEDEWYHLLIQTKGDVMSVFINDKAVAELKSEGIAHTTKSSLGMATPGNGVFYDDFVVRGK